MLSLAEYQAYTNDLDILGQQYDQEIGDGIDDDTTKGAAITHAKSFVSRYQRDLKGVLDQALYDVAGNALEHYQSQVSTALPDTIVKEVVNDQYKKRYYGANLSQRIVLTRLRLNRVITQTAQVGTDKLGGLFSDPIPFGSQTNISRRLLQGTIIKTEQDVARKVASEADYPFIRWTLSKHHRVTCQCEALASQVDDDVKSYLDEHNLDIDPEGLFFVEDLPDPPHPNCQCEFNLVGMDEAVPSRGGRTVARLRRLIRKLFR